MGERTSYPHGTFSWVENATTDQDGAKRFYTALFGWEYDDSPVGDGVVYSMAKLRGSYVAAIAPQRQEEREMGVPPHWNSYVTVDDIDAASAHVEELGGKLLAPPFDVMEVGRMSVLSDPTGAVLCLWQPRQHIGAGLVNVPGAFSWNELGTRDPVAAEAFYSSLLGWEFERMDAGPVEYWTIRNAGRENGGMRRMGDETPADVPPHWLVYLAVEDIDASESVVADGGGRTIVPKTEAGPGNAFAVFADPPGATFGVFQGHLDE
ncbi:MAG TPA: VOC family protein [Thermoleophilaceae bacterium]|nr:VOC family protein [Thermoleophilaceae bacterium]